MQNLLELKGQKVASRMLTAYLTTPVPGLLILHGPDGTGRFSAATAFIRQRLCRLGNACGKCDACLKTNRDRHPDVIIFPETDIRIGDQDKPEEFTLRWLIRTRLIYSPFEGQLRFIVFPDAARIQTEAETALLKSLEEAQPHTKFIFIARDLADIKPTIISRGVTIPFYHLPSAELRRLIPSDLEADFESLLGGSLDLLPFAGTELYLTLRKMIQEALQHPSALLDLERWLSTHEKKSTAALTNSNEFTWLEILDFFSLLLLKETYRRHPDKTDLCKIILEYKGDLHKELPGMQAYLTSRLFHQLAGALHTQVAGNQNK